MINRIKFLKSAIFGKKVGAISRSSKYVTKAVLNNIGNLPLKRVIEYGPGDGIVTRKLLDNLSLGGKMLVIETDKHFAHILENIGDSRLIVIQKKIQDVIPDLNELGFENADLIVSSIPFSLIEKTERDYIVLNSLKILKPDGIFIVFHQYSKIMVKPLRHYFGNVKTKFELRNVLPCFIMCSKKL